MRNSIETRSFRECILEFAPDCVPGCLRPSPRRGDSFPATGWSGELCRLDRELDAALLQELLELPAHEVPVRLHFRDALLS